METFAASFVQFEGLEVDGKYVAGPRIAEGERHAVCETLYQEKPAVIKFILPESPAAASSLLENLAAARELRHPNLITIHDFGSVTVQDAHLVYVVMERADENLAGVLQGRTLDEEELRQLFAGAIPALEFLHGRGYVHSRIRPSNILACGDSLKLSADRLRQAGTATGFAEPAGLHDAPETAKGQFGPAADVWSLAVLTLESLTGSPLESSVGQLNSPFRQIVEGGMNRDPERRWTLGQIKNALNPPAATAAEPRPQPEPVRYLVEETPQQPKYRKLAAYAIGGVLVATALCILLIRGASHPPVPQAPVPAPVASTPLPAPAAAAPEPAKPSPVAGPTGTSVQPGWAIIAAAYNRQGAAEKRAAEIRRKHPGLNAHASAADPEGHRFVVLLGSGLTESEAKKQLADARRAGAPRDSYITRFR
jgi:hypothetical protein